MKAIRPLLALLVGAVLVDVLVGFLLLRDGTFLGRPVPKFGALTNDRQRETLEKWRQQRAEGGPRGDDYDRELGWCPRPFKRTPQGEQRFNSIGARGVREYADEPAADTLRVVTFGDSFTFCSFVDADETWQARIEAREPSVEVLNFGVMGYGTDQALLRFRRQGLAGAQVAVMGFMLENAKRNVNRYRPMLYPEAGVSLGAKPRFVLAGDALEVLELPYASRNELFEAIDAGDVVADLAEGEYWSDPTWPNFVWSSSLVRLTAAYRRYAMRRTTTVFTRTDAEPYRVTLALLEHFHGEALAAGAREALVVVFGLEQDVALLARGEAAYWSTLLADLEASGVPAIDVTPALAAEYSGSLDDSGVSSLFHRHHLTPSANAIVASELLGWLEAQGLVP